MPPLIAMLGAVLIVAAAPLLALAIVPDRAGRLPRDARRAAAPPAFVAPRALIRRLDRNLQLAGLSTEWSMRSLVIGKAVGGVCGLLLAVLVVALGQSALAVLLGLGLVAAGYFAPDAVVALRARERQDRIQLELADTLDQIVITLEAGIGLETAIARAGRHGRGPLAFELARTVRDMQLGSSRREAYAALAERTTVEDLQRFARAIQHADAYGVSIGSTVRTQAQDLRVKRRQRAEERAMKVPVRVLFPLMLCILPVLFIIVLAPAVMNLIRAFGSF